MGAFLPLLLPTTFVSAQDDLEVVVGENAILADLARQGDTDVNNINLANTALDGKVSHPQETLRSAIRDGSIQLTSLGQKIPDDIQNLSNYTVYVYTSGAKVAPATKTDDEDKVTDSYNEVRESRVHITLCLLPSTRPTSWHSYPS